MSKMIGKLTLNKQTLKQLDGAELTRVVGGDITPQGNCTGTCTASDCLTCTCPCYGCLTCTEPVYHCCVP